MRELAENLRERVFTDPRALRRRRRNPIFAAGRFVSSRLAGASNAASRMGDATVRRARLIDAS